MHPTYEEMPDTVLASAPGDVSRLEQARDIIANAELTAMATGYCVPQEMITLGRIVEYQAQRIRELSSKLERAWQERDYYEGIVNERGDDAD